MRQLFSGIIFFLASVVPLFAQQYEVKGNISDLNTKEALIGASVTYAEGKGTTADIDGNYLLQLDAGDYELTVSYVGYTQQKIKIKITSASLRHDFYLETTTLKEVEVTADVARIRETPVAFTNVSQKKITEELGSRDLPMILNSTPGVYATEQGGGAGDARINIRGFDQRNVAVLVDGVPVNDLESGAVFWSNWAGLGDITRTVQVQRGLGASKLAVASVGGTINTMTRGIESERKISVKQEVGNDNMFKTTLSINSGKLKGGWGITAAGSRLTADGYADQTWDDAWSYFFKVQKELKKHLLSFSVNGAPQKHGQRTSKTSLVYYDKEFAQSLGINADSALQVSTLYRNLGAQGIRYNYSWGEFDRYDVVDGDTVQHKEILNYRVNHFHKPVFNLSDFWTVNGKMSISNVAYLSLGYGGGTNIYPAQNVDTNTAQVSFQKLYDTNRNFIDVAYSTSEHKSTTYIYDQVNNHVWYGLLSTLNYTISNTLTFTGGLDLRGYTGIHYETIYDFLGGDYMIDGENFNQPKATYPNDPNAQAAVKHDGDHIQYDYYSHVKWGGIFTQLEYKKNKWSAFITLNLSQTGYQRFDYFQKKDVVLEERTFNNIVGWGDTLLYDGSNYFVYDRLSNQFSSGDTAFLVKSGDTTLVVNPQTYTISSSQARKSTTNEKWYLGYTIKGGANYNINSRNNVFVNAGYMQIAPKFTSVFDFNNREYLGTKPQYVTAAEIGYSFHSKIFSANLNGYYTMWENKPYTATGTYRGDPVIININGIKVLHQGVELDFAFKIFKPLTLEGLFSYGDWRYKSASKVTLYSDAGDSITSVDFSAMNVHVGDAAQTQIGGGLRYEPIKNLYVKGQLIYFDRYYADFSPTVLTYGNKDRESWRLPSYHLADVYAGYGFKYWKLYFNITLGVFNLLDTKYISDATNNGNGYNFDATSATVFVGQGRRFNTSLKITF